MGDFSVKRFFIDLNNARAGTGEIKSVSGRAVKVAAASSPTANVNLAMQGDFTADPLSMILQAEIRVGQGFEGFYITNDAQPGEWLVLIVTNGDDDFDYAYPVSNAISSIASVVNTSDADAHVKLDTLHADLSGTHADLVAVKTSTDAITTTLKNKNLIRAALTDLTAASYAEVNNATTTVVAAGANPNGIVLRLGIIIPGVSGTVAIKSGAKYVLYSGNSLQHPQQIRDIILPAGQDFIIFASDANGFVKVWYEVL